MSTMDLSLKESLNELSNSIKLLTTSHEELKSEIKNLREECGTNSTKFNCLDDKLNNLQKRLDYFQRQERGKNLILYNVEDNLQNNNNLISTVSKIFQKIGLQIPDAVIIDVYRLGKNTDKKPIIVKFVSSRWVRLIFTKLENIRELKLSIANDRTKEEREARKNLLELRKRMLEHGKNVVIKGRNLIVDNQIITYEEANLLLQQIFNNEESSHTQNAEETTEEFLTPKRKKGKPKKTNKPERLIEKFFLSKKIEYKDDTNNSKFPAANNPVPTRKNSTTTK